MAQHLTSFVETNKLLCILLKLLSQTECTVSYFNQNRKLEIMVVIVIINDENDYYNDNDAYY